ncbi:class I SAM-dependent methyltransferase [Halovulum dunhuangense]|nr:class I SAM-dependent methyltransferase [Halovulum dunhuangense]
MTVPSSLFDQYERQARWRPVAATVQQLGPLEGKKVADLGCGSGHVARMFAARGAQVTGIDRDAELVALAARKAPGVHWVNADLSDPGTWGRSGFDIIWSSFTIAYAPDPTTWLKRWHAALAPGGRLILMDVGGLLDHEPIGEADRETIGHFCREAAQAGLYHFDAAERLVDWLEASGFDVLGETDLHDEELTFTGPAPPDVLAAWAARLARMPRLRAAASPGFTDRFLASLTHPDHRSHSRVRAAIGRRGRDAGRWAARGA